MYYYRKWRPSKTQKKEFAIKMREIEEFCLENGISTSCSYDSYYFEINDVRYRVSNHTIEASNRAAFDKLTGEQLRPLYHFESREEDVFYIHAGKTRIIEIYNNLKAGKKLDHRGYVID